MRILRGKSSSEVSSQGFALFVLGFIIATFFGGALHTLLNSESIQRRLLSEAQKRWPDVSIEIGSTQGSLSRGLWPGFVFKLEKLHFVRSSCRTDSVQVDIDKMIAPIALWSLWQGQPRLGRVSASGVKVHLYRQPCAKEDASPPSSPVSETTQESSKRINFDWTPVRKILGGLELSDVQITGEAEPSLKTVVHRLNMNIGRSLDLDGEIEFKKSLAFGPTSHLLGLKAQASETAMEFSVIGKFKEGGMTWRGQVDFSDQSFQQELIVRLLPMKEVLSELFKLSILDREMVLKSFWLSCHGRQRGVLSNWRALPVVIENCKLDGGQGYMEITDAQISLDKNRYLQKLQEKPIGLIIKNLELAPILEASRRDTLPKVFSKLGAFTGRAEIRGLQDWNLIGDLQNVEFIFSNQSVRGKQAIRSVHTELRHSISGGVGGISGLLSDFDLLGGQGRGSVVFKLDSLLKTGTVALNFTDLLLASPIQKMLFGGEMQNFSIQGEGRLLGGDLESWLGTARSSHISGQGWVMSGFSANTKFKDRIFHIDSAADLLVLGEGWSQMSEAKAVYKRDKLDKVTLRKLTAKIEIGSKGGTLQSFTASDLVSHLNLIGRGKWSRDHDFVGTLTVHSSQGRRLYSVLGRQNRFTINQD